MIAIGIDPSLSATGWALTEHTGGDLDRGWRLKAGGVVTATADGRGLWARVTAACGELFASIQSHCLQGSLDVIVVEMPMERMFAGVRRSSTTLPGYGVMCGAVAMMIEWAVTRAGNGCRTPALLTPSATQWAIGLPKAGKTGDRGKPGRVFAAEAIFGEIRVARGGVAAKEAIADAALLARWAIEYRSSGGRGVHEWT